MDHSTNNFSRDVRNEINETFSAYPGIDGSAPPCCFPPPSGGLMTLVTRLEVYLFPCLLAVGLPLNVLSSLIFMRTRLRKLTTVHYFIACGITDSLYLSVSLFPWLETYDIWIDGIEGICQIVYYLRHLSDFLSSWYMAFVLLDMWISTLARNSGPKRYCSVFKTRALIISVFVLALVALLYLTWTTGPIRIAEDKYICRVITENIQPMVDVVLSILRIGFSSLLPATVTFVLVFMRLSTCCSCREERPVDSTRDCILIPLQSKRTSHAKMSDDIKIKQHCFTAACLVLGIFFISMTVPLSAIKLRLIILKQQPNIPPPVRLILLDKLFSQLYYIHFAWKFIVYFVILSPFRMRLWKCCFPKRSRKSRSNAETFIDGEVV